MYKKIYVLMSALYSILISVNGYAQPNAIAIPKSSHILAKKTVGVDLVIPIELKLVNRLSTPYIIRDLDVTVNYNSPPIESQISATDIPNISIVNNNQTFSINAVQTIEIPNHIYLLVGRTVSIPNDKIIEIVIMDGTIELTRVKVTIQPEENVLSLTGYLEENIPKANRVNRLDKVIKVESNENILTISGYKRMQFGSQNVKVFAKRKVALNSDQVYKVTNSSYLINFYNPQISLFSVPFKVRPQQGSFKSTAYSGLSNLGFNLDFFGWKQDKYFSSGTKSQHRVGFGIWGAPTVEELDAVHLKNPTLLKDDEKSKQLFLSTGITLSYTYSDISFVFVPLGLDFGTSAIGRSWIYSGKNWWGFGIAVSPKIFSSILNK